MIILSFITSIFWPCRKLMEHFEQPVKYSNNANFDNVKKFPIFYTYKINCCIV